MRWVALISLLTLAGCGNYVFVGTDPTDAARETPNNAAALDCDLETLQKLAPTQQHARDSHGRTALFWAIARHCTDGAIILLQAGADPNAGSETTPLTMAAGMRNLKLVQALVAHGATVNPKHVSHLTPLHAAASSGDVATTNYLLSLGADIHTKVHFGATPLHYGARWPAVVKTLVTAGASVHATDDRGVTALMMAPSWPFPNLPSGAEGVRALLGSGADPRAVDNDGSTALIAAATCFDTEALRELLRAGADANTRTKHGQTALGMFRMTASQRLSWANYVWALFLPSERKARESSVEIEQILITAGATT
ncbi:MAG TPA: ankyrin repeat domain-containing protein [Bryobacteraceae bacterium]|nr:ankyrin repeat domain-containing protein [Bryobacteraceae bacterium]